MPKGMAQYMAIEPFFWHGQYHEASASAPFMFQIPEDEVPNHRWYPLDEVAAEKIKTLVASAGAASGLRAQEIPDINVPMRVPTLKRPPPPQDQFGAPNQEPETFSEIQRKLRPQAPAPAEVTSEATSVPAAPAPAEAKPKVTRPSDTEPPKQ